jgi:mannose-6-phosphate isomerase-like protein (cupin superfamily)
MSLNNSLIDQEVLRNCKVYEERPWGSFEVLFARKVLMSPKMIKVEDMVVKMLIIRPGQVLSEQFHALRAETWRIIKGTANITINGKKTKHEAGREPIIVPKETWHRIGNASRKAGNDLIVHEIAIGRFDEHDIKRRKDKYSRSSDWSNIQPKPH